MVYEVGGMVGGAAVDVSLMVHTVGAVVGGEAAGVSSVVHAVEAVISEKATGLSLVKVGGVAKSELRSLHERGARGGGLPRRRLAVGATVGATAVGAVMVEIARENMEELHDGAPGEVKKRKERRKRRLKNVQTRRVRERDGTHCVCVGGG